MLQFPVTLHQKSRISRKSPKDTHAPKIPHRPTDPIIAKLTLESQSTLSLCDREREERGHGIVERLAVSAVQFCGDEEDEGEGNGVEEVGVAADCDWGC